LTKFIKPLIPAVVRERLRKGWFATKDGYYRSLARRLSAHPSDDFTGLTYLFEIQPYSIELVLQGYLMGLFPTTFYDRGYVRWHDPIERGVLPIQDFHIPSNLKRLLRKETFEYRVDSDFRQVMEKCAEGRGVTHITPEYMDVYMQFHEMGLAHSVSVWKDGEMVGGRFGVTIGAYFSGESSFQRIPNAGKASLIRMAEILAAGGFLLRDEGWPSTFMEQFGERPMPREEFHRLHKRAVITPARFDPNAPLIFLPQNNP
jgi:leucyl/phenylalanyl-tRNA--protein transferase